VRTDGTVPSDLRAAPNPFLDGVSGNGHGNGTSNGTGGGVGLLDVAVPVVPEVC
jgi:hypothetical protein